LSNIHDLTACDVSVRVQPFTI